MSPHRSSTRLSAQPPRARERSKVPAYPALLCAAIAGLASACAYEALPDAPADAQAEGASDAEPSAPDADSGSDAGGTDEVQLAGCSATMYHAGPSAGLSAGAGAIAGGIAAGARYRRRRTSR